MPTSPSRLAYDEHYKLLDQALASKEGIRCKYPNYGDAARARLELYSARKVDRKENEIAYKDVPDAPMYGKSAYDPIRITIELITTQDAPCWLYIKPMGHGAMEIEELGKVS